MPTFEYQAVTQTGQSLQGSIEAVDRAEAVRLLRQRGEMATSVQSAGDMATAKTFAAATNGSLTSAAGGGGGTSSAQHHGARTRTRTTTASAQATTNRREPVSRSIEHGHGSGHVAGKPIGRQVSRKAGVRTMRRSELASFVREIATALEAGLPLMNALRAVSRQSSGQRQSVVLDHLMDRIEAGRSFAQAAQEWGAPFDDMTIGMLRAGESSGKLEVVMLQLADLLDRELEIKRSVLSALIYPAILLVILGLGITAIVTFIIPRILESLNGQSIALPWPTLVIKTLADIVASYWYLIIGAVFIAIMAWRSAMAKPELRLKKDQIALQIPVAGALLRDVSVGRFARILGTMMASGIPIIDAILITRDTIGNKAMEAVIDEVATKIREGKSIAEPMERSGYFPPVLIQIIDLGERSGRLDEMLLHAATSFDRRTATSIKLFTAILPPVIVVIMALVIGFVILAVMLPLLQLQSAIG